MLGGPAGTRTRMLGLEDRVEVFTPIRGLSLRAIFRTMLFISDRSMS
jgi:hypothetical protein